MIINLPDIVVDMMINKYENCRFLQTNPIVNLLTECINHLDSYDWLRI
jgi:hypothetical protein